MPRGSMSSCPRRAPRGPTRRLPGEALLRGARRAPPFRRRSSSTRRSTEQVELVGAWLGKVGHEFDWAEGRTGERPLDQLGKLGEVLTQGLDEGWRAERRGRVKKGHDEHGTPAKLMDLRRPADPSDPSPVARKQLRCEVAKRCDDPGLDQIELGREPRVAGLDLNGLGVSISRRTAEQYVRDEHVLALEPDSGEELRQEPASTSYEREALTVLLGTRSLADEHQARVGVAGAEDHVRSGRRQGAPLAHRRLLVD